ncbi:MAG: MscL family protein [Clostridia bacterium]|nr:MscL family protein [Clostridia bacterium]MDY6183956.1 MscL family protein [Eubacteriales bacterium]
MSKEDQEALDAKIAEGEKRVKKEKRAKQKKQAASFWADFKKFITRGNIVDMAIGVIVGSAFTAIVTALSNQIIKPIINFILMKIVGKDALSEVFTFLNRVYVTDAAGNPTTEIDLANSIYIDWGAFINAILNFLIIAMCLFIMLRIATNVKKRMDEAVNHEKIQAEKAAAEAKAAEEKAAAEAKAEADAKAAEAQAAKEKEFYENVRKQTELLEKIAANIH